MPLDEICNMKTQLNKILDKNCVLFLWTSGPIFDQSLRVMQEWGFKYTTVFTVWEKVKKDGINPHNMALGWWSMSVCEFLMVGTRGTLSWIIDRTQRPSQLVRHVKNKHSEKPELVRTKIEQMLKSATTRPLELFGRRLPPEDTRLAWSVWGNEV